VENSLFSEEKFPDWAKDYVLFCHVTTRIPGMKNDDLLGKKGGQGFPHFVYMDADGDVLATHEDDRTMDAMTATAAKAKEAAALKAKAAKGDAAAQVEWLTRQIDSGTIGHAAAIAKAATLKLDPERKKALDKKLFDLEILDIRSSVQSEADVLPAAKKILALAEAKKVPEGDEAFDFYWQILCGAGNQAKDAKLFAAGYELAKDRFGDNPKYKRMLEEVGKQLDALRKDGGEEPASKPAGGAKGKDKK
jgi:hypothetical protein